MTQDNSIMGGTTHNTSTFSKQSPGIGNYPSYFYKPPDNIFDRSYGKAKAFHLTQPDEKLAKLLYSQGSVTNRRKNVIAHEAHSMHDIPGTKGAGNSIQQPTFGRSPRSIAPMENRGLVSSQRSVESTDTIRAFFN